MAQKTKQNKKGALIQPFEATVPEIMEFFLVTFMSQLAYLSQVPLIIRA